MDGVQYTFNGLGEYLLVKTSTDSFVLQGRTILVDGSTATVFSAFTAAQFEESDDFTQAQLATTAVHAELTPGNGLRVLVCCYGESSDITSMPIGATYSSTGWRDITASFSGLDNTTRIALDEASLARPNDQTLVASFSSGISVRVEVKTGLLIAVWAAPDNFKGDTRGLLGVWDGNTNNDFTARNGASISIDSSDRQIHSVSQTCMHLLF